MALFQHHVVNTTSKIVTIGARLLGHVKLDGR